MFPASNELEIVIAMRFILYCLSFAGLIAEIGLPATLAGASETGSEPGA